MKIDRDVFFDVLRSKWGRWRAPRVTGLSALLDMIETDASVRSRTVVAYMLATVKHECADTWEPITERGSRAYFDKYNAGTPIGDRLGNTQLGDGYLFRGRGYVQITGRANYIRLGTAIGVDLVGDPGLALHRDIAYQIMSAGMRRGLFTGKRLSDYFGDGRHDYRGARRIINGLDRADLIADYARDIEAALAA